MKKILSTLCFILLCLSMAGCQSEEMKAAIAGFEAVSEIVEQKNNELDSAIQAAETLLAENSPVLDASLVSALETAISECKAAKHTAPELPQKLEEVIVATEEMRVVDYANALEVLAQNQVSLEDSIRRYALVNAPTEAYVIECLKKVPNIIDIAAVTEDNDPNGQLNKQGGYIAHVYFSSDLIGQSEFDSASVIEKGTDCGGSIEVYSCVEDAIRRNEYLSTFDGGILASGSHVIVGTVLVRTSDKLTASQQKALEANIIAALTDNADIISEPLESVEEIENKETAVNGAPVPDKTAPTQETNISQPVKPSASSRKEMALQRANELAWECLGAERPWVKSWLVSVELFSEEEAQYAVDNCQVEWNEEALELANSMGRANTSVDGSWMTPNDIARDLRMRAFTNDEISYAVKNCTAFDWITEATTLARIAGSWQQFNNVRTYTFNEVVAYLQSVGFTEDAALIGATLSGIDWSARE